MPFLQAMDRQLVYKPLFSLSLSLCVSVCVSLCLCLSVCLSLSFFEFCMLHFWFCSDLATVLEPQWAVSELGTPTTRTAGELREPPILPLHPPLQRLLLGPRAVQGQQHLLLQQCQTHPAVTTKGLALMTAGTATCATTSWCSIADTLRLSLASSASTFSQAWTRGRWACLGLCVCVCILI